MRKLFSFIAAVLFAGSMMAQVTITPDNCGWTATAGAQSGVVEGVTVANTNGLAGVDASTGVAAMRIYKNATLTISAESNIVKIEFTCVENGTTKFGPGCFEAQEGYTFEAEGPKGTWVGSAKQVDFVASGNQVRATQIVVTLEGEEEPDEVVIYDWANKKGVTIFGGNSNITTGTVKIHKNVDEMPAIVFASSYVYADGKYIAIKPAEGGFKAGDVLYVAAVFSDNNDSTKYAQVDLRAADGDTRIWLSDSASTIDVKTSAAEPIVQTYKLESDQDSLLLGRYGNTKMYILTIMVGRPEAQEEKLTFDFKLENNILTITPSNNDPWAGWALPTAVITEEFGGSIEALVEVAKDMMEPTQGKVSLDITTLDPEDFPAGTECTFVAWGLVEGAVTTIDSYEFVIPAPLADPTNCAEAAEAALSVEKNGDLYNGGKEYTIEGYVTEIATAWSSQYNNISFWMADEKDGGKVLEAYRAACAAEADAPAVGDKVKVTGKLTKYNTTPEFAAGCTFVITEKAEPQPAMNYYVVGTMTDWTANANYKLAANPAAEGEFMGEFAFKANDGFKVAYSDGATIADDAWFPDGMENEYKITEDGDYAVYFRPDGQGGEGWHYGYIYVAKKEAPVVDTITCAKAAEDALAGETYETYVKGYVTEIAYAWKDGSMSFWMADEKDGGKVFEAYKCAIEKEEDAVRVGDLVKAHGTLTKYNTTPELAAGCTVEILERAPEVVPQNLGEKTIAEFLELKNRVDTCILTGTVKNIVMDSQDPTKPNVYGNFDLEDATASVYVYGLLTPEGEAKKFQEMDIVEGDVIIIKALYNEYNNNPQVKNAILVRKIGQGLDNTGAEVKVEKFFRNGQLIIRKNGVEYNAQGAIVR